MIKRCPEATIKDEREDAEREASTARRFFR
jgi:hypothetical protein